MDSLAQYFDVPKVISQDEYNIDKEDIKYEYNVIKRDNYYYLFDKDDNPDHFSWIIYDLSNIIRKKYGEVIYAIVEKNEDGDIEVIMGNSFEPYFELYHTKYILSDKTMKSSIEKLNSLLDLSFELFGIDEIYVFNINLDNDTIYDIFKNRNVKIMSKRKLKSLLSRLPVREKISRKIIPYIFVIIFLAILYGVSTQYVKQHNEETMKKMDEIKRSWISKIDQQSKVIMSLEKEIDKHSAIEKLKDKKIYEDR